MNAEQAYLFRHAVLRDAAYQLQLPGERARLHALALDATLAALQLPLPALPDDLAADDDPQPHPVDSVAADLYDHARLALEDSPDGATSDLGRWQDSLLWRRALHATLQLRPHEAASCWESLSASPRLSECQRAGAIIQAGRLFIHMDAARGRALLDAALRACRSRRFERPERLVVRALNALWRAYRSSTDQNAAARKILEEARRLALACGDPVGEALSTGNLAYLAEESGDLDEAARGYLHALTVFDTHRMKQTSRSALISLANVVGLKGDYRRAQTLHEDGLARARLSRDRQSEGFYHVCLGDLHDEWNNQPAARQHLLLGLECANEVGDMQLLGRASSSLGILFRKLGDIEGALRYQRRGLAIALEIGARSQAAIAMQGLGQTLLACGQYAEAESRFVEAAKLCADLGAQRNLAVAEASRSEALWLQGKRDEAITGARNAVERFKALSEPRRVGIWLSNLSEMLLETGRFDESDRCFAECERILAALKADDLLALARQNLNAARLKMGLNPKTQ